MCIVEISKNFEFAMGEERNKINVIMELFEPNVRKLLTYFTMNFSSSDY